MLKVKKIILLLGVIGLGMIFALSFLPKRYHFFVRAEFTSIGTPYIDVAIDGNSRFLLVDLGCRCQVCMTPEALDGIEKISDGTVSWTSDNGESYEYPQHQVSKVGVGPIVFKDVVILEKPLDRACVLWDHSNEFSRGRRPDGCLGKNCLQTMNLLFDLGAARIGVSNDLKKLKQDGYDLEQFNKVPIEITDQLILVEVNTELGPVKLALDTGASTTTIKSSVLKGMICGTTFNGLPFVTLGSFVMGGHDFGKQGVYVLDNSDESRGGEADGVIGMNFIGEHVIYFDFLNKVAYFRT